MTAAAAQLLWVIRIRELLGLHLRPLPRHEIPRTRYNRHVQGLIRVLRRTITSPASQGSRINAITRRNLPSDGLKWPTFKFRS
ncbi:hypothetical protein FIBSPDRAFT_876798 [Athelia psychrophila]|uniref:Uncharacterized protein n=1 Tax=Athelia psychrophila TaxID=1759441 RepID=A0A167WIF5_9AGAM|nr:hypothetical protein FIBSPDRAFT_876798 [Fibularhizoctonia sp. CBS 109695]